MWTPAVAPPTASRGCPHPSTVDHECHFLLTCYRIRDDSAYYLIYKLMLAGPQTTPSTGRPWSKYEDKLLTEAVASHGADTEKWKTIALAVPGRTNKACRKVLHMYHDAQAYAYISLLFFVDIALVTFPFTLDQKISLDTRGRPTTPLPSREIPDSLGSYRAKHSG